MAVEQDELTIELLSAEAGFRRSLTIWPSQARENPVGTTLRSVTEFAQERRLAGLVTTQSFADGVAGAAELTLGGVEAVGAGKRDQPLMQPATLGAM